MSVYSIVSAEPTLQHESKSLFFPYWVGCPYDFYTRLVWASLIDSARRNQSLGIRAVGRATGLSRQTVKRATHRLAKDNLLDATAGLKLIEPADDAKYWVVRKGGDGWINQFAYTKVDFNDNLTVLQSVILAKIPSLSRRQCPAGIAEMLGICTKTVRKTLGDLIILKRLNFTPLNKGWFMVDLPPVNNSDEGVSVTDPPIRGGKHIPSSGKHIPSSGKHIPSSGKHIPTTIKTIKPLAYKHNKLADKERKDGVPRHSKEYREKANRIHLNNIGCEPRQVNRIIKLWDEKLSRSSDPEGFCLILNYSAENMAASKVRTPGPWIIAELNDHLGYVKRKPPKEKIKVQPTAGQIATKEMWAEHYAADRELGCLDTTWRPLVPPEECLEQVLSNEEAAHVHANELLAVNWYHSPSPASMREKGL